MISRCLLAISLLLVPGPVLAGGGKSIAPVAPADSSPAANLWTGEGVNFGGVLFPHFHFNAVYGRTSFAAGADHTAGHHDPIRDGWTVQGLELGMSGRFGEHVESFAIWHGFWDHADRSEFDSIWEEYFLKFKNLPGGLEVRGGQLLNRFGLHNAAHQHHWDWADNNLVSSGLLGEHGLTTRGAEVTWRLPVKWTSALSASYGEARTEAHDHADEAEEHLYDAADAAFAGDFWTANWTNTWQVNDFHRFRAGLSAATGDNAWDRTTQLLGAHVQYEWRENGLEPDGDYFRWRAEVIRRDADALIEDHAESGTLRDWGLYTSAVYGHALARGVLEGGLRYDYLDGESDAGLPRRHRISPVVSYYVNPIRTAYLRAQVNFDDIEDHGGEDSVWLSFGFNWGGPEVR